MVKARLTFFFLIIIAVIVGLLSRHFTVVPLWVGDVLWALMVYFIVRFLFINKPICFAAVASLAFCYAIEFSQLYKAPWIDNLRHTLFGRLVLGDVFLWSDLLCYTVGIAIGILLEKPLRSLSKKLIK